MAKEIERKFLVRDDSWRPLAHTRVKIAQGYLSTSPIEVRVSVEGEGAYLTVKVGGATRTRSEYEYEIPIREGRALLRHCREGIVVKDRYRLPFGGLTWEIDVFGGTHAGLVLAEIELPREDHQIEIPGWIAEEVTGDAAYYNATLADRSRAEGGPEAE